MTAAPDRPDPSIGADVPFLEYPAEAAVTNGVVIGPDWAYGTVASEAVNRQAVLLEGRGAFVEFVLEEPANAVNVRLSIPDSADGAGIDATLGVLVDGQRIGEIEATSRYSWYYGVFPWSNNPADGGPRQMYGDSRVMFDSTLPAGTIVRLEVGAQDVAPWYAIDVADFEEVASPATAPQDALSIEEFGADATGAQDSSDAIQAAIDAASGTGRIVWIPEGVFRVTRHLIVDDVTMRGAGPWYSVLTGRGVGVYGNYNPTPSSDVHLSDFAIFGEVDERIDNDQVNAIGGALGDSTIDNVWLQHTKVGMWLDGPFDNLVVTRARILSQTADGLNFHNGVTNSSVSHSYVRSTGDDGLAMWSHINPNSGNTFTRNTVKVPVLANNIAIYGGADITVSDNWVTDTVTQGGGIQIANRFDSTPLGGTTTVTGNRLDRTGSLDLFSYRGNGALTFWAGDGALHGNVQVSGNSILNSAYSAVQFLGQEIANVSIVGNTIDGTGTFALQLDAPGSATFSENTATRLGGAGVFDCNSSFEVIDAGGNSGWDSRTCVLPSPGVLDVQNLGEALSFSTGAIGEPSEPRTVVITNPTASVVRIASATATGSYRVASTCGTELAPGASCVVTLVFAPTVGGDRNGSLTVSDGTSAGRYQVYLRGEVFPTTGNLALARPATATSEVSGCCTAGNATDGNATTYWESVSEQFPQVLVVDFGRPVAVDTVVVKLPPGWGPRTQTLEILSGEGDDVTSIVAGAEYVFDPNLDDNAITIDLGTAVVDRYLQVRVTGNTGWPAAQIAEFEAYNLRGTVVDPGPGTDPEPGPGSDPAPGPGSGGSTPPGSPAAGDGSAAGPSDGSLARTGGTDLSGLAVVAALLIAAGIAILRRRTRMSRQ